MMMVKIENFNQTGVMEGARAVQVHNFTSMKQDVLDLCDSRYDAKIKKCCAEQSIEVLATHLMHQLCPQHNKYYPTWA